jgi:hypothetical protein
MTKRPPSFWNTALLERLTWLLLAVALVSFAGIAHAEEGPCGDMALAIAMSSKLESGGLSKDGSFLPLVGEPYSTLLICSLPGGMSLHYVAPNPPSEDWFAFVSQTGSVLTERRPPLVRRAVERCIKEAQRSSDLVADVRSQGFEVHCGSEKSGRQVEVLVTQRLKQ